MSSFNNFIELFLDVWQRGIFGINASEIIIGLIIFLFFYVLCLLYAHLNIRYMCTDYAYYKNNENDGKTMNIAYTNHS